MSERDKLNQEIIDLQASLSSNSSRIGDWAVMKCWEAEKTGDEMPYDLDDLLAKRAAARKRINEIQEQLKNMPEDDKTAQ